MTKRFSLKNFLLNYLVLVAIVLLVIITIIVEPKFLSGENLTNIMRQFGPLSFVSLGMTFVIIGGFIDLSVAGIISLVAVVTVSLIDPLGQVPALILGMTLFTLVPLLLSHGFAPAWRPLVGTLAPSAISDGWTMLIVLVVDILGLSVLVAATGGSQQSPFQAVYFLLPTLALFLRQSPTRVLVTATVVFVSFSVLMGPRHFHNGHGYGGDRHNAISYWFVSMASLAVAVYIGLATTPP